MMKSKAFNGLLDDMLTVGRWIIAAGIQSSFRANRTYTDDNGKAVHMALIIPFRDGEANRMVRVFVNATALEERCLLSIRVGVLPKTAEEDLTSGSLEIGACDTIGFDSDRLARELQELVRSPFEET